MVANNFKRNIVVITAGLSSPSSSRMLADRMLTDAILKLEEKDIPFEAKVFELRDYAQDIMNNMLTGFPNGKLEEMLEEVLSADGLIMVTPIFSSSYSGLFKSFLDIIDPKALIGRPVLIGATAGTQRHSLAIEYNSYQYSTRLRQPA